MAITKKKRLGFLEIKKKLSGIRFSADWLIAIALLALDDQEISVACKILEIAKNEGHPLAKRYLNIIKLRR